MSVKRFFVVGCSRSGTTILQKEISKRARLFSLPETAFFREELANPHHRLSALNRLADGLSGDYSQAISALEGKKLHLAMHTLRFWRSRRNDAEVLLAVALSKQCTTRLLLDELDLAAEKNRCIGWLEKTPLHCFQIDFIRNLLRPNGFIFSLRDGLDTVASLRDRAEKYPERFGHQWDIRAASALWNRSLMQASEQLGRSDVYFVSHEVFTQNPERALANICVRFELDPADSVESAYQDFRFFNQHELWKTSANQAISPQPSKSRLVLTERERNEVIKNLNLPLYDALIEQIQSHSQWGIAV